MSDREFGRDGTRYRLSGVDAKAAALHAAAGTAQELATDRAGAATTALEAWRGAHAGEFVDQAGSVLSLMVGFGLALRANARLLDAFPSAATWTVGDDGRGQRRVGGGDDRAGLGGGRRGRRRIPGPPRSARRPQ